MKTILLFVTCCFPLQASEIITLRAIEYPFLNHAEHLKTSVEQPEKLYAEITAAKSKDGFRDVEIISVSTNPGKRCTIESVEEVIYPSEYEPSSMGTGIPITPTTPSEPEEQASKGFYTLYHRLFTRPSPVVFEPRNAGSTLEVHGVIVDGALCNVNLNYEYVRLKGWEKYSSYKYTKGINHPDMPNFIKRTVTTNITIPSSTWQFIGFRDAWRSESPDGAKVAFFVRVDPLH